MSAEDTKYDVALFTLAKQSGGVQEFLNNITSFLRRRTKFFTEAPNGEWEGQLLSIFHEELDKLPNAEKDEKINEAKAKAKQVIETDDEKLKPNAGNGCNLANYAWTQTLKEIELKIPLNCRQHKVRARDIYIEIGRQNLKVSLKGQTTPLVSGELSREIKHTESTWMLEADEANGGDGHTVLNITLEKVNKTLWWDRLMMTDPAISLTEIEPEKVKLTDLDRNQRDAVEKLMQKQRQQQMGLPTTTKIEHTKMEVFDKFKEAHPELDFSKCKFGH